MAISSWKTDECCRFLDATEDDEEMGIIMGDAAPLPAPPPPRLFAGVDVPEAWPWCWFI